MYIGVSTPSLKNPLPPFLAKPPPRPPPRPLKSANGRSPPFLGNPPLYIGFRETPPVKLGFFHEPQNIKVFYPSPHLIF